MDTPKGDGGGKKRDALSQFGDYRLEDDPHVQVAANYLAHIQRNFDTIFGHIPLTEHQRDVFLKVINAIQSSQRERYETRWPFPVQKDNSVGAQQPVSESQALSEAVPRVVGWIIEACTSLGPTLPTHELMDAFTEYNDSGAFEREYKPKS